MVCGVLIGSDTAGQKLIGSTQLLAFLSCWTCFFPLENTQTETGTSKHCESTNPLEYCCAHTFKRLSFFFFFCKRVMRGKEPAKWLAERLSFETPLSRWRKEKCSFSTLLLNCFYSHFRHIFHTALSPDGFGLSLLCVGGCFPGASTNVLLAVDALFDLLLVILFGKGVPEEAEDL